MYIWNDLLLFLILAIGNRLCHNFPPSTSFLIRGEQFPAVLTESDP